MDVTVTDGKLPTTLSALKLKEEKKPDESALQYADRVEMDAFVTLHTKKKRNEEEESEYKDLKRKVTGAVALDTPQYPSFFFEDDFKAPVERVHRELVQQFGNDTPQKRMLIQRITCAWGHSLSYERMFKSMKYNEEEYGSGFSFSANRDRTRYLAEVRRGMESVNDQIIRLTQALQNIAMPPIQVVAKNAFFAQNQQINQGSVPKDLEVISEVNNNEKTNP
jgi:hypothetical protein